MIRTSINLALVAFATVASSSVAMAAPTPWAMPAGDHGSYTYSMGQTLSGNFGSGNTYVDGFYFIPGGLKAQVPNNNASSADTASDTASVVLNAKVNQMFSRISSGFLGDYSIFGAGNVDATAALRVTNLDTAVTLTAPLAFGGTVPASTTTFANSVFDGQTAIDLPDGWRNIRVELDGVVMASAQSGSSFIQAKDAELSVQTTAQIPLPAAMLVTPVLAAVGYRARRKLGLVK